MITLKLAQEEDYGECLRMAKAFHEVSPYSSVPMDEDKVRLLFDVYREKPDQLLVLLACAQEKPIGLLVATCQELYFSKTKAAGEIIWWVDEPYRKSTGGLKLYRAFEFWAKKIGASFITGVNTTGATDVSKVYVKNGYHLAESTFLKVIEQ